MHTGVLYLSKYTLYFEILTKKKNKDLFLMLTVKTLISVSYLLFHHHIKIVASTCLSVIRNHELAYCRQFPISLLGISFNFEIIGNPVMRWASCCHCRVYRQFLRQFLHFPTTAPCSRRAHLALPPHTQDRRPHQYLRLCKSVTSGLETFVS